MNFKKIECLSGVNEWKDEQMGLIYSSLIEDEEIKVTLNKNSYKILKGQLMDLKYPKCDLEKYKQKLENLKQTDFYYIRKYEDTIEELMYGYSHIRGLSKKENERMQYDIFNKGLGMYTAIKVYMQDLQSLSVKEIKHFLKRFEDVILIQVARLASNTMTQESNMKQNTVSFAKPILMIQNTVLLSYSGYNFFKKNFFSP